MKILMQLISLAALSAVVVPCLLYFAGVVELDFVKSVGLGGTIVWFIATPLWMGSELPVDAAEVEM